MSRSPNSPTASSGPSSSVFQIVMLPQGGQCLFLPPSAALQQFLSAIFIMGSLNTIPETTSVDPEVVAAESSVPRSLTTRDSIIVVYGDCTDPHGFGCHSQATSLAYFMARKATYPVVLLCSDTGLGRFNTLCDMPGSSEKKLYGNYPVRIATAATLSSLRYKIAGYVATGCKFDNENYVQRVMIRDAGKAALVETLVQRQTASDAILTRYFSKLLPTEIRGFVMGFGPLYHGNSFTPFTDFSQHVLPLNPAKLPPVIIAENPGYGLFCASKPADSSDESKHIEYAANYLSYCYHQSQNKLIIAVGDLDTIRKAVNVFSAQTSCEVVLVDCLTMQSDEYDQGRWLCRAYAVKIELTTDLDPNKIYVLRTQGVPQVNMRQLLVNAGQLIGFSSASMAIDALGEGKLLFYRCIKEEDTFLQKYLDIIPPGELRNFARLLATENEFCKCNRQGCVGLDQKNQLLSMLKDQVLCQQLATLHQQMTIDGSETLTQYLFGWLNLPRRDAVTAPKATSQTQNTSCNSRCSIM